MVERTRLLRWLAITAGVLYAAAFLLLSYGGATRSDWIAAVAVAFLVLAAVLLQLTLSQARDEGLLSRRNRLLVPLLIMACGVLLLVYWGLGTRFGFGTGGFGLAGVCLLFLGAGQALSELRSRGGGSPRRGAVILAICGFAFVIGLVLCLERSAGWLGLAAAALFVAPVGLTLLSEDVLRRRPPRIWLGALLGLLLVAAGGIWLLEADVDALYVRVLVVVLLVLVGAIASSTQADVLLVVTAVAVIWVATPEGVAPGDTVEPQPGQDALVSLGDSYMSGEGTKEFFEGTNSSKSNECRRSPRAYAHIVVQPGHVKQLHHLAFYACSGANAVDVYSRAQYPDEPLDDGTPDVGVPQLSQLRSLLGRTRIRPRLVIVSIGGNDAGFAKIGMACLAPGSCVERGQIWLDRLTRVGYAIRVVYDQIRGVVGTEVPVLVIPYPQVLAARGRRAQVRERLRAAAQRRGPPGSRRRRVSLPHGDAGRVRARPEDLRRAGEADRRQLHRARLGERGLRPGGRAHQLDPQQPSPEPARP
jgi:GDSL-like lipase/acylhydrolase family protein